MRTTCCLLVLAVLTFWVGLSAPAPAQEKEKLPPAVPALPAVKWEYKVVNARPDETLMNKLGTTAGSWLPTTAAPARTTSSPSGRSGNRHVPAAPHC